MKIRFLLALSLCLVISQICQSKSKPNLHNPFITASKGKIELIIGNNIIQLKSPDLGGFSNCKPYLAWRNEGAEKWTEDFSNNFGITKISEKETKLTCPVGPVDATITIKQLDDNIFEFSGRLKNTSPKTIEMARFHYLQGTIDDVKTNFTGNFPESFRLIRKTDSLPAPRLAFEKFWKGMGPDYPMLSNPIHDRVNWATSKDFGIFSEAFNKPGWFFGFTGPGTAYGEVGYKTLENPSPFFAGVLLDNIILEPDSTRTLEKFIVYLGDWQEGMAYWVKRTAAEFSLTPQTKPLVGYCSWYQEWFNVSEKNIKKANEEFANMPVPPGGRTVQIDEGWETGAGNWHPNQKFETGWKNLPKLISKEGSIPGLWIAPTAIDKNHSIVKEHPEMLQKFKYGAAPIYFPGLGYFMDPDRPDCKDFIRNFMKEKVQEGWRYFKVDFTYPLSTARIAYNRKKTQFESHRDLYQLLRVSCGPDVLINSCIGCIDRYPLGSVNIDRIGGDIGGEWNTVQGNLRDLLSRACTNGYWWQADADVFYMRQENTKLNTEENFLLTGTIGMIGGVFLTSDYPSQWNAESRKAIGAFWNAQGPRIPTSHFVDYGNDNSIKAYLVSYNDGKMPTHKLGVYNWSDKAETVSISLEELKLKPDLKWKVTPFIHKQTVELENNAIVVKNMPPHSLRIVDLKNCDNNASICRDGSKLKLPKLMMTASLCPWFIPPNR